MGLLVSIFFGFFPTLIFAAIVYWMDRYEKEPKVLLGGVYAWGALFAAGGAFLINTVAGVGVYLFTGSEAATDLATGSLIAPVVEESLKGLAVLLVFIFVHREFDSILDGIVYAAITALGFAATENAYYIYTRGFLKEGWNGLTVLVFIRVFLVGWQHPFYTAFTGIGLAVARINRNPLIRFGAPVAGWILAVSTHALHNTLSSLLRGLTGLAATTLVDWTGWFFMILFVLWANRRESLWMVKYLQEEVGLGTITASQYQTACSAWSQGIARLRALFAKNYRFTHRFYDLCGELIHKKHQLATLGEEGNNSQIIAALRTEMARLSPLTGK